MEEWADWKSVKKKKILIKECNLHRRIFRNLQTFVQESRKKICKFCQFWIKTWRNDWCLETFEKWSGDLMCSIRRVLFHDCRTDASIFRQCFLWSSSRIYSRLSPFFIVFSDFRPRFIRGDLFIIIFYSPHSNSQTALPNLKDLET